MADEKKVTPKDEEGAEPCVYIYTGRNQSGQSLYQSISNVEQNDGRSIEDIRESRGLCYDKPLFKYGKSIGIMFPAKRIGSSVIFTANTGPIGYWENEEDKAKWQLNTRAAELYIKRKKDNSVNQYDKILAPIREAYAQADYLSQPLILAEVIRTITKGR